MMRYPGPLALLFSCVLACLFLAGPSLGEEPAPDAAPSVAPSVINYQGRFSSANGDPLSGPVLLRFRLFAVPTGGSPLWTEEHIDVALDGGIASVLLGSLTAFPSNAFSAPNRYLEVEADGQTLEPRLILASSPFAMEADRLDGKEASDFETAGAAAGVASDLASSDGSAPNEGDNRVHWDNLAGVPEGFADGTDDGNGGGTGDHGELTGLGDDDHAQYLLRSDASTSDGTPPNQGSARVHWDNLAGVPPDFADGEDETFPGGGLTGSDVKDSSLAAIDLVPGTLVAASLADGAVTGEKIALETITGDNIQDDGIRGADVLDGTLTASDLATAAVTTEKLADGAVTTATVADGSLQEADFGFAVGDVTSVSAGPGLSGGGDSGDISFSVGQGSGIDVQGQTVSLAPSYISGSAYDGRFVARANPTWSGVTGAVAVPGAAFRPTRNQGSFTVEAATGAVYVDDVNNAGAEDEFTAPVQLPHGATIDGFRCSFWDNSAGQMELSLWRIRQDGSSPIKVATLTTDGEAAAWVSQDDPTILENAVDNIEFLYWLEIDFPATPQGADLKVLGVRITYTITQPH